MASSRHLNDTRYAAEALGLTYLGAEEGTRHTVLRFQNSHGAIIRRTMHKGSKNGGSRDEANTLAELRRFARGHYHGLRVTLPGGQK